MIIIDVCDVNVPTHIWKNHSVLHIDGSTNGVEDSNRNIDHYFW